MLEWVKGTALVPVRYAASGRVARADKSGLTGQTTLPWLQAVVECALSPVRSVVGWGQTPRSHRPIRASPARGTPGRQQFIREPTADY